MSSNSIRMIEETHAMHGRDALDAATGKDIPAALVRALEQALLVRDVHVGFKLLDEICQQSASYDRTAPTAVSFLLCLAQWVDLGYRDLRFLDAVISVLWPSEQDHLSAIDFFKLRLVESFCSLAKERFEESITTLDLVLRSAETILPQYLLFVGHFWKGRAHRKRGEYELAQTHFSHAQHIVRRMHAEKLVAVIRIHESWLAFQRGERASAFELLETAESVLKPTGHALSLGNIESARGRFVRRSGDYKLALSHFERAIAIYRKSFPDHPNLARALVNAAYVKRLMALDWRYCKRGAPVVGAVHAKSLQIAQEALGLLDQAGKIYALHHHQSGAGSVLVNAAHIHLESGDIDLAETEGDRAFALGRERQDILLMARAQVVRSAVSLMRAEEQLGEEQDVVHYAKMAVQHAEDAIELALGTQNKRLLAEAYIARGMAATDDYFKEWQVARDFARKASTLLSSDDRDHLYRMLAGLQGRLLGETKVEETLRLWSDGQVGEKTFQQVQQEFAELVIPKVWQRCGKSVNRVARTLSMSPKKIRRILRAANERDPS